MKMKIKTTFYTLYVCAMLALLLAPSALLAQESSTQIEEQKEQQNKITPFVSVAVDYHIDVPIKGSPMFAFDDVYFGANYEATLGKYFFEGTFAINGGPKIKTDGKYYWNPVVELAYVEMISTVEENVFTKNFVVGLQNNYLYSVSESFWGYYHVTSGAADEKGLVPITDLGVAAGISLLDSFLKSYIFFLNGDGHQLELRPETQDYGANLTLDFAALWGEDALPLLLYSSFYYHSNTGTDKITSLSMAGLDFGNNNRVGYEITLQGAYEFEEGVNFLGQSVYFNLNPSTIDAGLLPFDMFVRWNFENFNNKKYDNSSAFIIGWAYTPVEAFQEVISYKIETIKDKVNNVIQLDCLFEF